MTLTPGRVIGALAIAAFVAVFIISWRGIGEREVEKAVLGTGIIGSTPAEARQKLQSLVLSGGRKLEVGDVRGDTLMIAVLPKAYWRFYHWNIYSVVRFDGSERAVSVRTYSSAESPL